MVTRHLVQSARRALPRFTSRQTIVCLRCAKHNSQTRSIPCPTRSRIPAQASTFHTSSYRYAQGTSADAFMETLTDLYATAKDEFEIAAEETEKNTTYAEDDRTAAREALTTLKEAFEKVMKESDPEVAKEVTSRVGQRIRELENAVTAMEESAIEH